MTSVSLENVTACYSSGKPRSNHALQGVSIEISEGSLVVVIGPSGCGKTTLLRSIAGLMRIDSGKVRFDGKVVNAIAPRLRDLAMVFQSDALYSHLSVRRNLTQGVRFTSGERNVAGIDGDRSSLNSDRILTVANRLGIDGLLDRKPFQLSGGERQRVALARTFVRDPAVFLLDEPFSGIDPVLKSELRKFVKERQRDKPTTMILVTHDQDDAMMLADSIVVMQNGEVKQIGSPDEIYQTPNDSFVAAFFGRPGINLLDAQVVASDGKVVASVHGVQWELEEVVFETEFVKELKQNQSGMTSLRIGIRPEHISLTPEKEQGTKQGNKQGNKQGKAADRNCVMPVTVLESRRVGPGWHVEVETSGPRSPINVVSNSEVLQCEIGHKAIIAVDPKKIHFFDTNSGRNIRRRKTE